MVKEKILLRSCRRESGKIEEKDVGVCDEKQQGENIYTEF